MFKGDDATMRPPAVVTTMGELKRQYNEPDWCPPPQQEQRRQKHRREQVEGRDYYCSSNAQRNNFAVDERDSRIPTNNFQYPESLGRVQPKSPPSPPRHNQYLPHSPPSSPRHQSQQPQMSQREVATYWAAIKAVDDSINADGRGSITVLRGLWKVYDAAVSELGTELSDLLSNKAIFEGKPSVGL